MPTAYPGVASGFHVIANSGTVSIADGATSSWSRDGRTVYFTSDRSGRDQIWRVAFRPGESAAGEPEQVTFDGGLRARIQRWENALLCETREGIFFVVPGAGGPSAELRYFDFAKRSTRVIHTLNSFVVSGDGALAVSPDGRMLLFAQVNRLGSDISLVENIH